MSVKTEPAEEIDLSLSSSIIFTETSVARNDANNNQVLISTDSSSEELSSATTSQDYSNAQSNVQTATSTSVATSTNGSTCTLTNSINSQGNLDPPRSLASPQTNGVTNTNVTQPVVSASPAHSTGSGAQSNSCSNSEGQMACTIEYLSQLIKDTKQLQTLPNVFMHVERLLEDEINRVRKNLFQINHVENKPLVLPEPEGPIIQKQEKVYVPIHDHPNFNFVGRILGPRGMTAKQLEQDTGCKIMIRGKGSMRNKHMEEQNRGKPNWEHLNDELHVLILAEDTENRAKVKIARAIEEVKKLLVPITEGEDELKKKQLMELAIINGTYKDSNARMLENEQLKLLQQPALAHPNQTHQLLPGFQHVLAHHTLVQHQFNQQQAMLRNSAHALQSHSAHHQATAAAVAAAAANTLGAPLMMSRPTAGPAVVPPPPPPSQSAANSAAVAAAAAHHHHQLLLSNGAGNPANSVNAGASLMADQNSQAAAAAAFLYPHHYDHLSYAAQLGAAGTGFIEYPNVAAVAAAQAAAAAAQEATSGKQRVSLGASVREHPYQRPSSFH